MKTKRSRKITALFFLIIFSVETLWPAMAWAVTNGPAQPELQKFEPAGNAEVVDLFSGDMKYNIPLLDVGGYPLNLSYSSGTGMEDESSWVGAGWNLNPGSITRNLRGLPDDFSGDKGEESDLVIKRSNRKAFEKIGANIVVKPTLFGWETGKLTASLKMGVYYDNYYGIGSEVGVSLGFNQSVGKRTALNAGLDVSSDSRTGVSLRPSLQLSVNRADREESTLGSLSGSFTYNTRAGLKQASLGASFSPFKIQRFSPSIDLSANYSFGQTYTPSFPHDTHSESYAFSYDGGVTMWGVYLGLGGEGYYNRETILDKETVNPAYGYMNYVRGRKAGNGLIDFNREKDGTFIPGAPAIAIPVPTQDYFLATSQGGSAQFRPFFGGNYVVFDKPHRTTSSSNKLGVTVGGGWNFKVGGRFDKTEDAAETGKWTSNNEFLGAAEKEFDADPAQEQIYFKQSGELTAADKSFQDRLHNNTTEQVPLQRINGGRKVAAMSALQARRGTPQSVSDFRKMKREKRTSMLTYLTAKQAKELVSEKLPSSWYTSDGNLVEPDEMVLPERVSSIRKQHHISAITTTDNTGKRTVYGIPVYNNTQTEASFSVSNPATPTAFEKSRRTGQIAYTPGSDNSLYGNNKGRENLFSSETLPGYATSWLLTDILSSDYIDRTGDGVTSDDYGTAIKFNYRNHGQYKWRAPYGENAANYNEGYLSDVKDDKASYTYGEKEIWYLSSVKGNKMVAIFHTSDRQDGLGVNGENGGKNSSYKLQKLDSVRLYTDAEFSKPPAQRIPLKVVHFEYDYSLFPNMPNNSGLCVDKGGEAPANCTLLDPDNNGNVNLAKGKLTLKKVYFTFGHNQRGKSNPYVFHYDNRPLSTMNIAGLPAIPSSDDEYTDNYLERQTDRWGTYKKSFFNRQKQGGTQRKMNNSEFPYTLQNDEQAGYDVRKLSDWFASHWQLNKIETPTGSIINVEYEADDYAFVQDRKAMKMFSVVGIQKGTTIVTDPTSEGLIEATGLLIELPKSVQSVTEFRDNYLKGADGEYLDKVFYKIFTDVDNKGHNEYVQGHAAIDPNLANYQLQAGNTRILIPFPKVKGVSPMSFAGWQMLKYDLPQLAYKGYDNSDASTFGQNVNAVIKSIVNSLGTFGELTRSFEDKASSKKFVNRIHLAQSSVRLYCHSAQAKVGGGVRVKLMTISDEWNMMGGSNAEKTMTGLLYDYTTNDGLNTISSGVASYEPQLGNEENPFREPVNFTEKVHWGIDRFHYIERPFGETFFPAPIVGYSKVTVTSVGHDWLQSRGNVPKHTGYIENEFYTAKDFPTIADNLPLDNQKYENTLIARLFTCTAITRVANSQGFKVELNDMHGKQKAVSVYNQGGDKIASTEYFYNTVDENAATKELNNNVPVLLENGNIENRVLGTDMDFATDVRQSNSQSVGIGVGAYTGFFIVFAIPFSFPFFYGAMNISPSIAIENYNAISTVKVINKYGILKKVRSMKDGAVIDAENLLWDEETGSTLLSSSQNEYDDKLYTFDYPAYRAAGHEGMQGAYKNLGMVLNVSSNPSTGAINSSYADNLYPGDELINLSTYERTWIFQNTLKRMMNSNGDEVTPGGTYMVVRSGKRNLTSLSAGTVVTMKDPRVTTGGVTRIEIDVNSKILDAKATMFKDEWQLPVPNLTGSKEVLLPVHIPTCFDQFFKGLIIYRSGGHRAITERGNINVDDIHFAGLYGSHNACIGEKYGTSGGTVNYYFDGFGNTIEPGESGYFGRFKMVFDATTTEFNTLVNSSISKTMMEQLIYETPNTQYIVLPEGMTEYPGLVNYNLGPIVFLKRTGSGCGSTQWSSSSNCTVTQLAKFHFEVPADMKTVEYFCIDSFKTKINPYYEGMLGNWRVDRELVYSTDRTQLNSLPYLKGGTDIRKSGNYKEFSPFWLFSGGGLTSTERTALDAPSQKWIWAGKSVSYDKKGNLIESAVPRITNGESVQFSDLRNVYSSTLYGFKNEIPFAIAGNARQNEIAFDGFEDYHQTVRPQGEVCPSYRHFDFGIAGSGLCGPASCISSEKAHTGLYSMKFNGGTINITKKAGLNAPAESFLNRDPLGFYLVNNEPAKGFSPIPGKKYIFSCWVNDNTPDLDKIQGFTLTINNTSYAISGMSVPVVEGWKRLEVEFTADSDFKMAMRGNYNSFVDDIRIYPADAKLNSYVYHDQSYKLMAQLDENNFATFFEYDEEGTPIRVKKETERGIMTIKENRQYIRKRPNQ